MKFKAEIIDNKLIFNNPNLFNLEKAKLIGKKVVIELKKERASRSLNQNSYLYGVIMPLICGVVGVPDNESYELWEAVKIKVGFVKETKLGIVARASSTLTTIEFEELMTKVRTWASIELKCYIPHPNEQDYL